MAMGVVVRPLVANFSRVKCQIRPVLGQKSHFPRSLRCSSRARLDKMPGMVRRFQFRLRTMLIAVALSAVACLVTKTAVSEYRERVRQERIRQQRAATDRIWDSRTTPASLFELR